MSLSQLNGKRIVIVLTTPREQRILLATARYTSDSNSKGVLRIELDGVGKADGNPVLVIENDNGTMDLVPDTEFGCDYRIGISIPQ